MTHQTDGPGLYEITPQVERFAVGHSGPGLLTLFLQHTSCSLLVQENADPSARRDIEAFFDRFLPDADHPSQAWITHLSEGPDDMPAHLKAALLPTTVSIPTRDGDLMLGTWQGIFLFEHRRAPHRRSIIAHLA